MIKKKILLVLVPFLWLSSVHAAKRVIIDLSTQTATAYENGDPVFSGRISTGRPDHPTPRGTFHVLEKALKHKSSSWPKPNGGARMNYMQRLTGSGIAMHLGFVPNYPASHGCIRLENGFAQRMFSWTYVGMPVKIVGTPPARVYRPRIATKRLNTVRKKPIIRKKSSALDALSTLPRVTDRRIFSTNMIKTSSSTKHTKMVTQRGVRPTVYRKPKTLDMLSTSPKAAKRVEAMQRKKWKNRPKRKTPRVDPLKAMRT